MSEILGNINIKELIDFHHSHGKIGTMSMYNFGQNKGVLDIAKDAVAVICCRVSPLQKSQVVKMMKNYDKNI